MNSLEVQVDRLVSSTHHYGGLSFGNIASMGSIDQLSSPLNALLEGLEKMRRVAALGVRQLIVPPQPRPDLDFLKALGFSGDDQGLLEAAYKENSAYLRAAFSSSAMWMANSASIAPSCDAQDQKVHFTPANLLYYPHRSIETATTTRDLMHLFPPTSGFVHHTPLLKSDAFSDEGAANHTIFTRQHGVKGIHLFVFGRSFYGQTNPNLVGRFPARQTQEASKAIARLHQLDPECVLCWQQSQAAIQAGVFHNDVISVGEETLFFYHEQAFVDTERCIAQLQELAKRQQIALQCIKVRADELSLEEAAHCYLFNAQVLRASDGKRVILVSQEALELPKSRRILESLYKRIPDLKDIQAVPLGQSMRNGGGPACLRLRVVLTAEECEKVHPFAWWTEALHEELVAWGKRYYRSQLHTQDLLDPKLREEAKRAQEEVDSLLRWYQRQ